MWDHVTLANQVSVEMNQVATLCIRCVFPAVMTQALLRLESSQMESQKAVISRPRVYHLWIMIFKWSLMQPGMQIIPTRAHRIKTKWIICSVISVLIVMYRMESASQQQMALRAWVLCTGSVWIMWLYLLQSVLNQWILSTLQFMLVWLILIQLSRGLTNV